MRIRGDELMTPSMEEYGTFGLVEMLLFIFILILGLAYAIRKKVLQWL